MTGYQSTGGKRLQIGHLAVDAVTLDAVIERITTGWSSGRGGVIVTPNVDIYLHTRDDLDARARLEACDLVVADGMPLIWSAKLAGTPLPERVTGSALVEVLAGVAAREGRSLFVIGGGPPETAERGAAALADRYPGLIVAGAVTPDFGFDRDPEVLASLLDKVVASGADLVYVGLGFPKQEGIGLALRERMPGTWFLGCGGGVQMAAGMVSRAPDWVQRIGAEWVARLMQEPRRLARRYLRDDLPVALTLLGQSSVARARRWRAAARRA